MEQQLYPGFIDLPGGWSDVVETRLFVKGDANLTFSASPIPEGVEPERCLEWSHEHALLPGQVAQLGEGEYMFGGARCSWSEHMIQSDGGPPVFQHGVKRLSGGTVVSFYFSQPHPFTSEERAAYLRIVRSYQPGRAREQAPSSPLTRAAPIRQPHGEQTQGTEQ